MEGVARKVLAGSTTDELRTRARLRRNGRLRAAPISLLVVCVAALCGSLPAGASAAVSAQPYGTNDAGGFRNVLPAGEAGLDNAAQLAEYEASVEKNEPPVYPPHTHDQLPLYAGLMYASPTLTHEQIASYYKDATFGVEEGGLGATEQPLLRSDVTIYRDAAYGVPHIYGSTRGGVMFGAGYAAAADRLFFIDVLRHTARAELSSFVGGAEGNRAMDRAEWLIAPYTEADLESQITNAATLYGANGEKVVNDVKDFVAGINAYIQEALINPNKMPAEYAALKQVPVEWKPTDVIAEASLIGGIFGRGGGSEVRSALALEAFEKSFGKSAGRAAWKNFREHNDPEAPVTAKGRFPYETTSPFSKVGLAMPAPGSVTWVNDGEEGAKASPTGSASSRSITNTPSPELIPNDGSLGSQLLHQALVGIPHASNWELVNAKYSTNGHSIAVLGPQVGYYVPQVLMEEDLHGPGIDARGAAFPGVNLYVELGHGRDYAWSATTATSDDVDTFAEVLCEDEVHYLYNGKCTAMEKLERTNTWTPNASDKTPPGSETLTVYRTVHGIVYAHGKVGTKNVAFVSARATYFHEADSALGFAQLNEPEFITGPVRFQEAVSNINFAFNWAYVDANNIAYYLSGWYPVRHEKTSPDFPILGTGEYDWQGFNTALQTENELSFAAHPNAINPKFLISWNNKQAKGWSAADDNYDYGAVARVQLIQNHVEAALSGGKKMPIEKLVSAMDEAATEDIRMVQLWPLIKSVLGTPSSPASQAAVAKLDEWYAAGGHRRDLTNTDITSPGTYQHNDAITIMDAWWPKLLEAEFKPALGNEAFNAVRGMLGFGDPEPGAFPYAPSEWGGWYGYVSKDLRDLRYANALGPKPKAAYKKLYCGNGSLEACRTALQSSLAEALTVTPAQLYGRGACESNPQASCFDMNRWVGAAGYSIPPFPLQNRPTFQQVVELTKTLPR
jgi:acyl-homoserine lactone acylase PvdQ